MIDEVSCSFHHLYPQPSEAESRAPGHSAQKAGAEGFTACGRDPQVGKCVHMMAKIASCRRVLETTVEALVVREGVDGEYVPCLGVVLTLRSPEMLVPVSTPVAKEKKMENMPKKLPSGPHHCGTIFSKKKRYLCKRTEKNWVLEGTSPGFPSFRQGNTCIQFTVGDLFVWDK